MKIKGMIVLVTGLIILVSNVLFEGGIIGWATGIILATLGSILFELELLNELLAEKLDKLLEKKEEAKEEKGITREACETLGGTVQGGRCIIKLGTDDKRIERITDLGKIVEEE